MPHDRTYSGSSVLANDTAISGDSLTASLVSTVSHGSLTLNANGTFTYTPAAGYLGSDSFTYQVHDSTNNTTSNIATVSLTVVDPHAPVAVADSYSVSENGTLTVLAANGVLSNDSDADSGDTLTAQLVSQPSHGTLTFDSNGDGGFVYTPNSGYSGSDSFTYQASDGARTSAVTTVTLTVNALAPTANNDTYSNVPHDRVYSGSSVLANDTAISGDSLTASLVSTVSHGSLTLNSNGTFSYTPAAGYLGSDSFTYQVHDATNNTTSNTATVSLTVVDPHAPVAVADSYSVSENGSLTVLAANGVLSNDSDGDSGDTLTALLVSQPSHGTLTFDSNGDGGFVYTPLAGYSGSDSFTYQASDGARSSAVTTVTLTVKATTVLAVGSTYIIPAYQGLSTGSVTLATFTDSTTSTPSASTYSATINWGDGIIDSGSSVTISVSGSSILVTGRHTYTSGGAKAPTVTLTKAGDSGVTATATVDVSTDVTTTLKPTASGLSLNRATKLYGGTMTLTNSTSSDVTSTGYTRVVLEGLSSQITVTTDYPGASVGRDANGDLYILLPVKKVAKNSSLSFNLFFNILSGVSLSYTPEVFVDTF